MWARARSSVEEHSPYKRGVAGSNPAVPTQVKYMICDTRTAFVEPHVEPIGYGALRGDQIEGASTRAR